MHRRGFEPLTSWFVAKCSIQLSYRCKEGEIMQQPRFLFKQKKKGARPSRPGYLVIFIKSSQFW